MSTALQRLGFAAQGRALLWRLSLIFVVLALLIELTLFAYWRYSLQPRLQSEAQAQISLLAQSQAPLLAGALAAPPARIRRQVQAALDQLLLLKGPSGTALIEGVSLEVDTEALGIATDALADVVELAGTSTYASEVALYHPDSGELIGIAKLWVSNAFFERFVRDVQRQMLLQALLLALCLSLLWAVFSWLIHRHEAQRQRDAESLALARDQALQASRAKSQFLANMSHEIRTPMNAVLGMANLLKKSSLLPKQLGMLNQLTESAKLLLGVLNDILDLSRIEANKLTIQKAPFRLRHALRSLQHMLQQRASDKGLNLEFPDPAGLPLSLSGDALRLQQVLVNLLINAIKFTDAGSVRLEITVHASAHGADAELESADIAEAESAGQGRPVRVRFAVRDTGVGIHVEDQKRLFDPFSQVDESDTRLHGGAGLGLAISQRLVELMGGTLQCQSTPGQGSEFAFELPMTLQEKSLDPGEETAPETLRSADTPPVAQRLQGRVLVVEDHPINREVAQALLEALGLSVRTVAGGKEALALLQQAPNAFDLVLMDIQMPEWDGIESTLRIKAVPALADLPIVALTAHAMSGDRERFLAQGLDDYLCKPLDEAELGSVLKRFLPSIAVSRPQHEQAIAIPGERAGDWQNAGIELAYAMRNLGGNYPLLEHLLMDFCQRNSDVLAQLQPLAALDNRADTQAPQRLLHTLRGAAAALGAKALAQAAADLEQTLRQAQPIDTALAHFAERLRPLLACAGVLENETAPQTANSTVLSAADTTVLRHWFASPSFDALQRALMQMDLHAGEQWRTVLAQTPALQQATRRAALQPFADAIDCLDYPLALGQLALLAAQLGEAQ